MHLRPSQAPIWMHCIESAKLIEKYELKGFVGEAAFRGTRIHQRVHDNLTLKCPPYTLDCPEEEAIAKAILHELGKLFNNFCLNKITLIKRYDSEVFISDSNFFDLGGTPDLVLYHNDNTATIIDYKTGMLKVNANTWQLKVYAVILLQKHPGLEKIRLIIIQPTCNNIDEYILTKKYIEEITTKIKTQIEGDSHVAGNHCRYCAAKIICPKYLTLLGDAMKQIVNIENLTLEQKISVLEHEKFIINAIGIIKEELESRVKLGEEISGVKLVYKNGRRQYTDPKKALGDLSKLVDDESQLVCLRSAAQIEKISPVAKEYIKNNTQMISTGQKLVVNNEKSSPSLGFLNLLENKSNQTEAKL